jgi:hypothetical protein
MRLAILLSLFWLPVLAVPQDPAIEAVKHADVARVEATIAGKVDKLGALLSEALVYGHADGRTQSKAEFLAAVASNKVRYKGYDYLDAQMAKVTEDVVTMTGRVRLKAASSTQEFEFTLRFLAVWRREQAEWRLFSYQSARLPD